PSCGHAVVPMNGPVGPDLSPVLGRCRLVGVIRREGSAVVCRAVHGDRGATCLVTILLPGARRSVLRGFLQRAAALAGTAHPALPAILDRGPLPSGAAFLAMERVRGETAEGWLRR